MTIWHSQLQRGEVVRFVSVVLHLANGESRAYEVGKDEMEVFSEQPRAISESDLASVRSISDNKEDGVAK